MTDIGFYRAPITSCKPGIAALVALFLLHIEWLGRGSTAAEHTTDGFHLQRVPYRRAGSYQSVSMTYNKAASGGAHHEPRRIGSS